MSFDPGTGEMLTPEVAEPEEASSEKSEVAPPPPASGHGGGGLDFYLSASEAAALVTERLGKKTTPATFRRMVIDGDAPGPEEQDDGTATKWSQTVLDEWLDAQVPDPAITETVDETGFEAAPDGKDFYLTASEAAALLSEELGSKVSVASFCRMVMAGDVPPAHLQAGGTPRWSQYGLDAWVETNRRKTAPVPAEDETEEAAEAAHKNVYEFFERTYSPYYELHEHAVGAMNRNSPSLVWCRQWWLHQSVMCRITAAWYAWEDAYTAGGGAMSSWILEHADRHFDRIMHEDGPFKRCKEGHTDSLDQYPAEPAPESLRMKDTEADAPPESQ